MKQIFILAVILAGLFVTATSAHAQVHVRGYTRSDGTYVQPYERSAPDNTVTNNYSFQGNQNPSTGSIGTNPYQHDVTSPNFNGTPDTNGHIGHSNNNGLFGNNSSGLQGQ